MRPTKRLVARSMALLCALSGGVLAWPHSAGAIAPDKQGYWLRAQDKSTTGSTILPANPAPPDGGLYVANDPSGATAVSAITYRLDGVLSATLILKVHRLETDVPSSPEPLPVTPTIPGAPAPPAPPPSSSPDPSVVHVLACAVEGAWVAPPANQSGAWDSRPGYDSTRCLGGIFNADATTMTFNLLPHMQTAAGVFDLTLIPDPTLKNEDGTNTPFSITFDRPIEESFTPDELTAGPEDTVPPQEPPPVTEAPAPAPTPPAVIPSAVPVDNGVLPAVTIPPTTTTTVPRAIFRTPPKQVALVLPKEARGPRIMALVLLFGLALAWWWVGGQESRGPQLLGSLAGEGRRSHQSGVRNGGIGRFARPRDGRPRRLL
jgi:hypothetical protein